tara:strand:+ start:64 stop:468 length:405 start_codon:yes stop_codon:yes gene_type:complete
MKCKIYQKKRDYIKPSSFQTDIKTKDPKSLKVEVSSFLYNDFKPDADEYEQEEITVKKSEVKYKIKDNKGKFKITLVSANVEFDIDDKDQKERFLDKDWETETMLPTLKIVGKGKKEEYINFQGGDFFGLELVY